MYAVLRISQMLGSPYVLVRVDFAFQGGFMKSNFKLLLLPAVLAIASFENLTSQETEDSTLRLGKDLEKSIKQTTTEGRRTFRFDTFGDEAFGATRFGCTKPSLVPDLAGSDRV
jgi:hypothetical protein